MKSMLHYLGFVLAASLVCRLSSLVVPASALPVDLANSKAPANSLPKNYSPLVGQQLNWMVDKHPWPGRTSVPNTAVLWFVGHTDTSTVIPVKRSKWSAVGDILVWNNTVYDSANLAEVAYTSGHCVRTVPEKAWDCRWTLFSGYWSMAVSGPFFDRANSSLAITGGTGVCWDARGWLDVGHRDTSDGTLDFVYTVTCSRGAWDPSILLWPRNVS